MGPGDPHFSPPVGIASVRKQSHLPGPQPVQLLLCHPPVGRADELHAGHCTRWLKMEKEECVEESTRVEFGIGAGASCLLAGLLSDDGVRVLGNAGPHARTLQPAEALRAEGKDGLCPLHWLGQLRIAAPSWTPALLQLPTRPGLSSLSQEPGRGLQHRLWQWLNLPKAATS